MHTKLNNSRLQHSFTKKKITTSEQTFGKTNCCVSCETSVLTKKSQWNPEGKPEGRICTLVLFCLDGQIKSCCRLQFQGQLLNEHSIHYLDHICGQTGQFRPNPNSPLGPLDPTVLYFPREGLGSRNPHIDRELW